MLHLGNISFIQSASDEAELEGALSRESLAHASELLQVRALLPLCPKALVQSSKVGGALVTRVAGACLRAAAGESAAPPLH